MSTLQPTLADPDKLGILVQCRTGMDKLKTSDFKSFVNSSLDILSSDQFKKILFIGMNAIKRELNYSQLSNMRSTIDKHIENEKKSKPKANKAPKKAPLTPIVTKGASFSKTILSDIISNHICAFLRMSSITKLAQCDRNLAVICHTPKSITNLMHRYDPYKYCSREIYIRIDGHYPGIDRKSQAHRFRGVQKLAIQTQDLLHGGLIMRGNLKNITDLSIYSELAYYNAPGSYNCELSAPSPKFIEPLPRLQSITFSALDDFPFFLSFFERYKSEPNDKYYSDIIYQLKSISFINCLFVSISHCEGINEAEERAKYANMANLLLPDAPNNLRVLKMENSFFDKTDHPECKDANDAFEDVERMKSSLCNLKGFAYSAPTIDYNDHYSYDLFGALCDNIVSNLAPFKQLTSLHLHSEYASLLSMCLYGNDADALKKILEFCCTVPMDERGMSQLEKIKDTMRHLNRLCVVIDMLSDEVDEYLEKVVIFIEIILTEFAELKIFQIVLVMKKDWEEQLDKVLFFGSKLMKRFQAMKNSLFLNQYLGRPLVFKFHIKACTPDLCAPSNFEFQQMQKLGNFMQNFVLSYLLCFGLGHIQIKFSWDHQDLSLPMIFKRSLQGLDKLLDCVIDESGTIEQARRLAKKGRSAYADCRSDKDFKQIAISAQARNLPQDITFDRAWNVDCQYCCNTPWV